MGVLEIYQDADCTNHDSLFCLRQQWLPTHSPATYINRVPVHQGPRNEGQKPSHNRLSGSRYVGFYRAYPMQVRRYIVLWRQRRGNTQRERETEIESCSLYQQTADATPFILICPTLDQGSIPSGSFERACPLHGLPAMPCMQLPPSRHRASVRLYSVSFALFRGLAILVYGERAKSFLDRIPPPKGHIGQNCPLR